MIENNEVSTNFTYFIGDMCYVLSPTEWQTVCAQVPLRGEMLEQIDSEDGYDCEFFLDVDKSILFAQTFSMSDYEAARPFVCFNTAFGDGCYEDEGGKSYPVDSGTLGMIDVRFIRDRAKLDAAVEQGLGHLINTEEPIDAAECYYEDGLITFGGMHSQGVLIDTAG